MASGVLPIRYINHRVVELPFGRLGIYSIAGEEHQSRNYCSPLIAIHESLRLRNVNCISRRDIKEVGGAVMKRCFQPRRVPIQSDPAPALHRCHPARPNFGRG